MLKNYNGSRQRMSSCASAQQTSETGGFVAVDAALGRSDGAASARRNIDALVDSIVELVRRANTQCNENLRHLAEIYQAQHDLYVRRCATQRTQKTTSAAPVFEDRHTVIVQHPVPFIVPGMQPSADDKPLTIDTVRASIDASQQRIAQNKPASRVWGASSKRRRSNRVPRQQSDCATSATVRLTTSSITDV